jgi:phospholipase C
LKQVSWVISGIRESDAPFVRSAGGPAWVNSIVQTAQKSRYWSHLAIIVVWASDGSEAFYDNVAPPQLSRMGLGLRVPMIVISPYAKRGYVSHTIYQNGGSTLRFIEESFGLKSLGATDVTANSIRDCFVQ